MKRASLSWWAVALVAPILSTPVPGRGLQDVEDGVTAFVHVSLVPMDSERILPDQTVLVRAGTIAAIGPTGHVPVPDGARQIDGNGRYLLPGLVDMHAHLESEEDALLLFVANGVTSLRNMWGQPDHLEWRRMVEAGERLGPTIYTTGPITDGDPPLWKGSAIISTPQEAERELIEQKRAGYDGMKIMTNLRPEVYEALLAASRTHGFPVYGHVPTRVGYGEALGKGQRSFEHLLDFVYGLLPVESPIRGRLVDAYDRKLEPLEHMSVIAVEPHLAARPEDLMPLARRAAASGAWFCPTLVATEGFHIDRADFDALRTLPHDRYVPAARRAKWDALLEWHLSEFANPERDARALKVERDAVRSLHSAGARLVAGTDTHPDMPYIVPGFSLHEELAKLCEVGLSPYEALRAATAEPASLLENGGKFGTVAAGRRADLILADANPLEEIGNAAKRAGVMVRGTWYPEAELRAKLEALAAKVAAEGSGER